MEIEMIFLSPSLIGFDIPYYHTNNEELLKFERVSNAVIS
jgi:hypothetical protein